jgi:hypothetical protein
MLLTGVLEHVAASVVTAMAVWGDHLYYAVARPGGLPRIFRWDGQNPPVEIVTPAWTSAPATIEINCMTVYNNTLWIGSSPNVANANNIEVWSFDGNIWTDASTFAGWAAVAAPAPAAGGYGVGWLFVFDGSIYVGQDTGAAPAITVQQWNGTVWANETAALTAALAAAAVASDVPTTRMQAPVLNNVVYAGAYDSTGGTTDSLIITRDNTGAWGVAFNFPSGLGAGPSDPPRALVEINSDIYAAQGWRSRVGALAPLVSGDQMKLARVTGTQYVRVVPAGYLCAMPITAAKDVRSGEGVDVALFAGPGGLDVFDPFIFDIEQMTDFQDDSPYDLVFYGDSTYASQGSDRLRPSTLPNLHSVRVARLD